MKKSEWYPDPKNADLVRLMGQALANVKKRPPTTTQCASTQAILDRPVDQDEAHFNRSILNWKAVPNAKTDDERVGWRERDPSQVIVVEDIRRKGRNTIGQPNLSGSTPETKERAEHAFSYSQPAALTHEQIQQVLSLNKLIRHELTARDLPAEPKPSVWKRTKNWFKETFVL